MKEKNCKINITNRDLFNNVERQSLMTNSLLQYTITILPNIQTILSAVYKYIAFMSYMLPHDKCFCIWGFGSTHIAIYLVIHTS